jgi:hypothetical protein
VNASRIKQFVFYTTLLLTLLSLHSSAFAQSDRGSVTGKVTDNTGAVLPGASITLRNEATGVGQTATSNQSGDYVFQLLNPGSYSLSVTAQGFKTEQRTHIVVDVSQANEQNVSLNIGGTTETVEVNAGGVQQLQTETGSIGLIVEQKSIQELPLIYGNPFTLETLAPGLTLSGVNPNIHTYDSSSATVSINGSVLNALEYRLDGAPDNRIRLSAYTPSTEFINQYKVETASYDATEGHSSGGFANVSLKSGSNAFHGGAFSSYQNPTLNTSFWHLGPSTPAKSTWLREGGDVGGPIWRNRMFFFGGYEHSREATPNVTTLTVPTVAERGGDFSELYAMGCSNYYMLNGVSMCPATGGKPATINAYQLYSPFTGQSVTGGVCGTGKTCVVRSPLAGNIIPKSLISPIATNILNYYPLPNTPTNSLGGGNYSYSAAEPNYYYAYVTRIDATLTPKQTIFGHWVQSRRLQPGKNGYFAPVSGTNLVYNNKGAALGYTYSVTPATVLDMHATWTRFVNQSFVASQGVLNPTSVGMPSYLVNGLGAYAQAFPRTDITGETSLQSENGVISHDDVTLGSVQVSHLFGNHFLRGGFEFRMYNTNAGVTTQSNGRYQNNGTYVDANSGLSSSAIPQIGFGLAQFEFGLPNSSAVTINSDLAVRSDYYAEWLQDDWKVTPKLTLNLGLRLEHEGPNSERNQKANTYFDSSAVNPISGPALTAYSGIYASSSKANPLLPAPSAFTVNGGLRFLGDPSTQFGGRQDYKPQFVNFLPRVGFSWELAPNTVWRAGFGVFYDSLSSFFMSGGNAGSTTTFLLPQQGFTQTTTLTGTPDSGLTFTSTLANPFPNGVSQPTGSSQGLATFLGQNVTYQPANPKSPYNVRWSTGMQHQFGVWLASADYVGNRGVRLPIQKDINAIPSQYLSTYGAGYDANVNTALGASIKNPFVGLIPNASTNTTVAQLVRPFPEFGSVTSYITEGGSIYHSLQASLNRRFTNGASLTSAFTWSKTLDATQYLNASDVNPWYGISQNDRTFRFATSGIYQLPFGAGRHWVTSGALSQLIGGWQVQGVYQVQSGQPLSFNPSTSAPLYIGPGSPANSAWGRQGFKSNSSNLTTAGNWFNTANWVTKTSPGTVSSGLYPGYTPNQYQVRTMPIRFDSLRADFLNQFDAAIQRNFNLSRLYENLSLQFRADAINALNHPVYGGAGTNNTPVTDWTSTTFGQVTAQTNQPRIYQFEAFIRF